MLEFFVLKSNFIHVGIIDFLHHSTRKLRLNNCQIIFALNILNLWPYRIDFEDKLKQKSEYN